MYVKFTLCIWPLIVNNWLVCSVQDSGVGILPEDLEKLFKFFGCLAKTKDLNRGGMGLGLTISKMLVQKMGGDINVNSVHGGGT